MKGVSEVPGMLNQNRVELFVSGSSITDRRQY